MLFKKAVLEKIILGEVRIAFRKWVRLTVKSGTQLHTPLGMVVIGNIKVITFSKVSEKDILLAGYRNLEHLRSDLASQTKGKLYRISLRYGGDDPRLKLRKKMTFSSSEKKNLILKISNMDQRGSHGPWVKIFLELISKKPGVRATELAGLVKLETLKFKNDMRKLKNLGLTISLGTGYDISPRGRQVLKML